MIMTRDRGGGICSSERGGEGNMNVGREGKGKGEGEEEGAGWVIGRNLCL